MATPARAGAPARCTPVHVVQAAGTGSSHSWDSDTAQRPLLDDSSSPAHDLIERLGAANVSVFRVPYPSTIARFNGLTGSNATGGDNPHDGTEPRTYGESHRIGLQRTTAHLKATAAQCPGTRFLLVGFSQGANIIGDAAALASSGAIPGVSADSIAAVTLIADPARSPLRPPAEPAAPSRLYGPEPAGLLAANHEIVNSGGNALPADHVGMAGARPGSFAALRGKVLSLCNPADVACSASEGSLVRSLADVAKRVEDPSPATGPTVLTPGLVREALAELHLFAATARATAGQGLTPSQMGALVVLHALPRVLREAASYRVLSESIGGLRAAASITPQTDAALTAALDAAERRAPAFQDAVHDAAARASRDIAASAGLLHLMDDPRYADLAATARLLGDFGPNHFAYYKDGYTDGYRIEGETGYDYAVGWMEQIAENIVAG